MLLNLPAPVDVPTLERLRVAPAGGFDVFEDVLFDTVTYPAAGAARLSFFTNTTNDATLTNVQPAGQLPAPHFFRAHRLFLDFLTEPSRDDGPDAAGRVRDLDRILNVARGTITFVSGATQRRRAPIPLRALGGMGGVLASVAGESVQHARNAPNGGFPFDQIIKHGETFGFEVNFAPGVAVSADVPLTLAMYGWRYVPVSAGR